MIPFIAALNPILSFLKKSQPSQLQFWSFPDYIKKVNPDLTSMVVLNAKSFCLLKFESEKLSSAEMIPIIDSSVESVLSITGKKLLMIKHYQSDDQTGIKIVRTELLYN